MVMVLTTNVCVQHCVSFVNLQVIGRVQPDVFSLKHSQTGCRYRLEGVAILTLKGAHCADCDTYKTGQSAYNEHSQ